jgi:AcrR family transcriptional regulator
MSDSELSRKIIPKVRGGKADRRAVRTRRMILQALMGLTDKDDLANQLFEELLDSITRRVKTEGKEGAASFPVAESFRRLQGQFAAHEVLQSTRGREYLFSVGQVYWIRRIERELKARRTGRGAPPIPFGVAAQMMTGAATMLLNWWIKNGEPYSPEQIQEMFDRMMMPGVRAVLGDGQLGYWLTSIRMNGRPGSGAD